MDQLLGVLGQVLCGELVLQAWKDHQHISSSVFSLSGGKWAVVQLVGGQGQVLQHQVGGEVELGMGSQQD